MDDKYSGVVGCCAVAELFIHTAYMALSSVNRMVTKYYVGRYLVDDVDKPSIRGMGARWGLWFPN